MPTGARQARPAFTRDLTDIALRMHAASPPRPHTQFVRGLLREVRKATGSFHPERWYRELLVEAGLPRRPSARTFTLELIAAKDAAGEANGPTLASVKELRRQMTAIGREVAGIKDQVRDVAASVKRQEQIGDALGKRQLLFADQSQTYQRQIEQLTAMVQAALRKVVTEVDRVSKAASDVTLDSHRISATIQQAARSIAEAAERMQGQSRQ
jgi:hypothetical protein